MSALFVSGKATRMHVRHGLALAAVVPLFLAGCGGDPSDEPAPSAPAPTTSAASAETPTESATPDKESAEDFIRRWQAAGDSMQETGKVAAYLAISRGCEACESLATRVRDTYRDGGQIAFAGSAVLTIERTSTRPPTFDVKLDVPDTEIVSAAGASPEVLPAGQMTIRVTLAETSQGWNVTHYGVL